jgi:hypothetical protein
MLDFEIIKFPIIIIATPRTGSTAFANHLASKYPNLKLYLEPDNIPEELSDFLNYAKNNNDFILKVLVGSLVRYPMWFKIKLYTGIHYSIKLKRRSLIEQVASHYIAKNRNIWVYHKKNFDKWQNKIQGPINIDESAIKKTIKSVKSYIDYINPLVCDNTFFYEDMVNLNCQEIKTPKPTNYIDLINKIEDMLEGK